jgi:hypothetical protein
MTRICPPAGCSLLHGLLVTLAALNPNGEKMVTEMDGDIVKPGDLHGRVLPADEIDLSWDGNLISAVVGPDLVEGVSGFGDAVHDALRELADHLIQEAVWVEITDRAPIDPAKVRPCDRGTIQTNVVGLYRIDEARMSLWLQRTIRLLEYSESANHYMKRCDIWRTNLFGKVYGLR